MTVQEMIRHYMALVTGLHHYLKTPVGKEPESLLREQLANRKNLWLDTVRRVVFDDPDHPYYKMFGLAGCTVPDLVESVRNKGLESTLSDLRDSGVYLSHDELKGKAPIVRSGREISSDKTSFDNPDIKSGVQTSSGGSRSEGTKITVGTACRLHWDAYYQFNIRALDLSERVQLQVKPVLPAGAGLGCCISYTRLGCPVQKWFAFGGPLEDSFHFRILTHFLVLVSRFHAVRTPFPSHLPQNDFSPAASLIAELRSRGQFSAVGCFTSPAVRIVSTALDKGLDIRGTLFLVSGEALTSAKRELIESAGCEVLSRYHIAEVGPIGYGCRSMNKGNSVHLFSDSVAAINYRQPAPLSDVEVNSLYFTTLLPSAAKILINADMDDVGNIEQANCDCLWCRFGFDKQISDIHSVGKLTGYGMSLVGTEIVQILEGKLPARFGGSPADYQLVEEEGKGETQLTLRVGLRVQGCSAEEIRDFFLEEIRDCYAGRLASRVWSHAEALRVTRGEPFVTPSGKVLPLQLMRTYQEDRDAP
jgi:hypothetical protein